MHCAAATSLNYWILELHKSVGVQVLDSKCIYTHFYKYIIHIQPIQHLLYLEMSFPTYIRCFYIPSFSLNSSFFYFINMDFVWSHSFLFTLHSSFKWKKQEKGWSFYIQL